MQVQSGSQSGKGMGCAGKVALAAAVVGFLCLVAGLVMPGLILSKLHQGVVDHVTLKPLGHGSDDTYYSWLNSTAAKDPKTKFSASFFQPTNLAAVTDPLAPASPVMEELPPVVFTRERTYFDVDFAGGDKEVAYNLFYDYVYDAEATEAAGGPTPDTNVTGVWPTFLTLLNQSGGTTTHAVAALAGKFIAGLLSQLVQLNAAGLAGQWGELAGFKGFTSPGESLSNSSLYLAAVESVSPTFYGALLAAREENIYPEFAAFTRFNKAAAFFPNLTMPSVNDTEFLLYEGGPCPLLTGTYSLKEPAELHGVPCAAALIALGTSATNSTAAQAAFPIIPDAPGSSKAVELRLALALYLDLTSTTFLTYLVRKGGASSLETGLWATRSVREWLFEFDDPLLELLKLGDPAPEAHNSAFFRSFNSSKAAAAADKRLTRVRTGRADVNRALTYVEWQNTTVLPRRPGGNPLAGGDTHYWCDVDVPVAGHDDTQFPISSMGWFSWSPGITESGLYPVWIPQLFRSANFTYYSDVHVRGISVKRLRLDESEFQRNVQFDEYYGGLLNLTCPQGGPPVMLTLPHYYRLSRDLPEEYLCGGAAARSGTDADGTYLDVDEISGTTLRGYKRLQLNLWVSNGTTGLTNGTKLVPSVWIEQAEELTAKQAHDYKNTVVFYLDLRRDLMFGLLIGGSVLLLLGVGGVVIARRDAAKRREEDGGESLLRPDGHDDDSSVYI